MQNSEAIKAAVAAYWRYTFQHPMVAFEASPFLQYAGCQADVLAVTKGRQLIETEVKISVSDFRKDQSKINHRYYERNDGTIPTAYFYFAVPQDLANKIAVLCDTLYPYAGVLGCANSTDASGVVVYRRPKLLSGQRLPLKLVVQMARAQSATICRLARLVEEQRQIIKNLHKQRSEAER